MEAKKTGIALQVGGIKKHIAPRCVLVDGGMHLGANARLVWFLHAPAGYPRAKNLIEGFTQQRVARVAVGIQKGTFGLGNIGSEARRVVGTA